MASTASSYNNQSLTKNAHEPVRRRADRLRMTCQHIRVRRSCAGPAHGPRLVVPPGAPKSSRTYVIRGRVRSYPQYQGASRWRERIMSERMPTAKIASAST